MTAPTPLGTMLDVRKDAAEARNDLVVFPNLTNEITKSLIHVDTLLRRGLYKFATEVLGKITPL
jgi:hypothetical protein